MKINWTVRVRNPVFWAHLAASVFLPVFAYFGINIEQINTWQTLGNLLRETVSNPAVIFSVGVSVWNLLIDPTTKGLGDSQRALAYDKPK